MREAESKLDARPRVIILGASNVSRSIGTIVRTSQAICRGPAEFLIAAGHGRSYGQWSSLLGRSLPGIVDCQLWNDWGALPEAPTFAVITDIGNDLLYEQPPERVAGWVEQCLARLAARSVQTVLTTLPVSNFDGLSEARFRFFRKLFVPRCRLGRTELSERAGWLDRRLVTLAADYGATIRAPRRQWYGIDPIHIRYGTRGAAWREVLEGWPQEQEMARIARPSLSMAVYLRTRLPFDRRLGGIVQRRRQPSARFSNGSTVGFF